MATPAIVEKPNASLPTLPYELLEQIFQYLFQRAEGPIIIDGRQNFFRHHSDESRLLVGERPRAYLLPQGKDGQYSLYSTHPLGQVNRQLRRDVSAFWGTAPVDVVTRVDGFDYTHVITFLRSLPEPRLQAFLVQPGADADLTRTLRIELSPRYDETWAMNLSTWLSTIRTLTPPGEELSTSISLSPQQEEEKPHLRLHVLFSLYRHWKKMNDGPAREEVRKILVVFWVRVKRVGVVMSGSCTERGWREFERWLWEGR